MNFPLGAFVDPAPDELDLPVRQGGTSGRWRHPRSCGRDPLKQSATCGVAGSHKRVIAASRISSAVFGVESKLGFALLFVGPVTSVAAIRENRADFAVEIDRLRSRVGWSRDDRQNDQR